MKGNSLISLVKTIEVRQRISVPGSVAADLVQVIEDLNKKRAPSELEITPIRAKLDKALEPLNMLRGADEQIRSFAAVEGKEMLVWFMFKGKRVALIEEKAKPS